MPWKVIEAANATDLQNKLTEWDDDNPDVTINSKNFWSFGIPCWLGNVVAGKTTEKHMVVIQYTEPG